MNKHLLGIAVFVVLMLAIAGFSFSQTINDHPFATDGSVHSIAFSNNTLYVGGLFSQIGFTTGEAALLDTMTGKPDFSFPRVWGTVYTIVPDGKGGCYIGGSFRYVDGIARNRIAHIKSDNSLDLDWNPNANDRVTQLVVADSIVYACGRFTNIGGAARNFIAALERSTGEATAWNPNPNSYVHALAISGRVVYVGGEFSTIGDSAGSKIAAIDAVTGKATSWNPNPSSNSPPYFSHEVNALAVSDSIVYVGGYFASIGGALRNNIAALDASTGKATSWNPNANYRIGALLVSDSLIYIAGYVASSLDSIGGAARRGIAALELSTGHVTNFQTTVGGARPTTVSSMAISGSTLYVGGNFTFIGGAARKCIAALDAATGETKGWDPNLIGGNPARDVFPSVFALAISGSKLFAGGAFSGVGVAARYNIAAFDARSGNLTDWDPSAGGPVYALAVSDSTVYAGGDFGGIGGAARHSLAAINTSTGMATSWNPNIDSPYPFVWSLAVSDSIVYVGGTFQSVDGVERNNLVAIDRTTGRATGWNPDANGHVRGIAISDSAVYVRGDFTSISGVPRNYIAAIDARTGGVMDWNPSVNGTVDALAISSSQVFVGGEFTSIDGLERNYIAALDASKGAVTSWNPNASAPVAALAISGSIVYAGGDFTSIGGEMRNYLAALDIATGNATGWIPDTYAAVANLTLDATNRRIYIVGGGLGLASLALDLSNDVADADGVPHEFSLSQNYPNPFNPSTTIEYYIPKTVHVNLRIYNLLGQFVALLVDEVRIAGNHRIVWRPTNLGSGIYYYHIDAGKYSAVKKLMLIN